MKTSAEYNLGNDQTTVELVSQFGYDISEATPEQVRQVELAIECAGWETHGHKNMKPTEFGRDEIGCLCAYIGGCIENNFNL